MERNPKTRFTLTSAATGLGSIALVVFSRRVAGPEFKALDPGEAVLYTAAFAAASFAISGVLADSSSIRGSSARLAPIAALLTSLVFLAGLSAEPLTVLSGILAVAVVFAINGFTERSSATANVSGGTPSAMDDPCSLVELPVECLDEGSQAVRPSGERHVELTRTFAGPDEHIAGTIRFETVPGEMATTLHVPLWPPLATAPRIRCELEGIDGRVSVPYVKPHGFRIEIRLPEPIDEPLEGTVRFHGEARQRRAAA